VSRRVGLEIAGQGRQRGQRRQRDQRAQRGQRAAPRLALALLGASLGLVLATALLGPSAATVPVPRTHPALPPFWLAAHPSPWLVSGLLLAALVAGAAGLLLGLHALHGGGWRPDPRRLVAGGALAAAALALVPPMGSADVLVYAAYGRLAALGEDPYTATAADLAARGDPIGQAVEAPWTDVPSAYGPVATAEHWLAAQLGSGSVQATVLCLALFGAAAYVGAGWLLLRLAGPDAAARARVGLLWWCNPLLLYEVVGGAHVDGLAVALAVAGLLAVRRRAFLAGLLAGAACGVKLTFGLYLLALLWARRGHPRALAALLTGAVLTGVLPYLGFGLQALDQVRAVSRFVSFAAPWRLIVGPLEAVLPPDTARTLVAAAAWVAFAGFAVVVARLLPGQETDDVTAAATRAAAVLTVSWLLTAPYTLPWYDVIAWAPLVALPASRLDLLLVLRTAVLGAAYVPGRVIALPAGLRFLSMHVVRGAVAPAVGVALLVAAVVAARRRPLPSRRPAAPPPPARQPAR
jgi:alpha-1,6-mannosyltransferase